MLAGIAKKDYLAFQRTHSESLSDFWPIAFSSEFVGSFKEMKK